MKILSTVQTICPKCRQVIRGHYVSKDDQVFLSKTCPEHGDFSTFVAPSLSEYLKWTSTPTVNIPPKSPELVGANEEVDGSQCPLHCGLCNNHLQTPCCVLIEITQRCNQHCPYCFACSGSKEDDPIEAALTLDVIGEKLDRLLALGEERPFNLQFSGGEPTVRDDLPEILALARSKGFPYLQVNTNGKRLAQEPGYAQRLKAAGASVVFLQFDGTDDKVYRELRNENLWEIKKRAIEDCRQAQLPVTLVPTLVKNVNMDQIPSLLEFLWENLDIVAGIHFQPVSFFGRFPGDLKMQSQENKVTFFELLKEIEVGSGGRIKAKDLVPMNTGHTLCGFHGTFLRGDDGSVSLIKEPEGVEYNEGYESFAGSSVFDSFEEIEDFRGVGAGGSGENTRTAASGKACSCTKDPLQTIIKDRGFVLNKWGAKGHGPHNKSIGLEEGATENVVKLIVSADREGGGVPVTDAGDSAGVRGACVHGACVHGACVHGANVRSTDADAHCADGSHDIHGLDEAHDANRAYEIPLDFDEFLGYMRSRMFTISAMAFQDLMSLDGKRLKRCRVHVLAQDNRMIPFCSYNTLYREKDLEKVRCLR